MKPADICRQVLGTDKLKAVLDELSAPQIKAVLKEGGIKAKLPGGYVSQKKRRTLWTEKVCGAVEEGNNDEVAGELLQQWLLHHRRKILIDFLDKLEVKHRQGETDDSFLVSGSTEKVRAAASWLLEEHDAIETMAYLRYIAHQQRSAVFDGWERMELSSAATEEQT